MTVGTAMEIVGYVIRTFSSQKDPYNAIYFVVQYFFIVVAPVFFSAAIYNILSIMINSVGRQYAPLPPKVILWIFITCDVVATVRPGSRGGAGWQRRERSEGPYYPE